MDGNEQQVLRASAVYSIERRAGCFIGSNMEQIYPKMQPINPQQMYSVAYFARLADVHPVTVYQSLLGLKSFPVPEAVRIGRAIRFKGQALLDYFGGLRSVKVVNVPALVKPQPLVQRIHGRGRPTKAAQMAKALAAGGAA